jgi:general nucleoside transport system permease protein
VIRVERRLTNPRWLSVAVPLLSLVVALVVSGVVVAATGHDPFATFKRIFERGFFEDDAITYTLISATPLLFTGLAAALAFRVALWNIGAEGQLYAGAVAASGVGLAVGGQPRAITIVSMVAGGLAGGMVWGLIPAILRAYFATNEIITSLMLNYVAGLGMSYLIFSSRSYWRDTSSPGAAQFPQGKVLSDAASWPALDLGPVTVPLGFILAIAAAMGLWGIYHRTRLGFEMQVTGDSPRAANYAGIRSKRTILAVLGISGGVAGVAGASQVGDFRHLLDSKSLQQTGFGYTGIVVAALARYNPLAVIIVAFLIGGLQNAGYSLQGPDFPAGLVGVMQGTILFCALGGEIFARYRVRLGRRPAAPSVEVGT